MWDDDEMVPALRERVCRVLVVDDNEDSANSLALLLSACGFESQVAYNGLTGLEVARTYQPDCLILDIRMPGMDGYTLAKTLRQEAALQSAKLIALSAYSDLNHQQKVQAAGFDYQLVKPADPEQVVRMLIMLDDVMRLSKQTEALARQNVTLASETKELLQEVKKDIQHVKEEMAELKENLRDAKNIG